MLEKKLVIWRAYFVNCYFMQKPKTEKIITKINLKKRNFFFIFAKFYLSFYKKLFKHIFSNLFFKFTN